MANGKIFPVYSIADITKLLGISRTTVYRLMSEGAIPYRKVGKSVRFLASDLKVFLDRNKVDLSQPVTLQ